MFPDAGVSVNAEEGRERVEWPGWFLGDIVGSALGGFVQLLAWTVILTSREAIFGII